MFFPSYCCQVFADRGTSAIWRFLCIIVEPLSYSYKAPQGKCYFDLAIEVLVRRFQIQVQHL